MFMGKQAIQKTALVIVIVAINRILIKPTELKNKKKPLLGLHFLL